MNGPLLRRYGVPVIQPLLGCAAWAGALARTFLLVFLPWMAIQFVVGIVPVLRVAFQKLAPPEMAGASSPIS